MSREFARRMPSYRGEVPGTHPSFSKTSPAAPRLHDGPVPVANPDLTYTAEDDKALEDWIRKTVATAWHSVRSLAMRWILPLMIF